MCSCLGISAVALSGVCSATTANDRGDRIVNVAATNIMPTTDHARRYPVRSTRNPKMGGAIASPKKNPNMIRPEARMVCLVSPEEDAIIIATGFHEDADKPMRNAHAQAHGSPPVELTASPNAARAAKTPIDSKWL